MHKNQRHIAFLALTWLFFIASSNLLRAQASQVSFGKNRVQYKDFDWQFYETDHFRIYFYQGGQDLGKYVILSSEKCLKEIEEKLEYRLSNSLDIIVYNDISDMHQTNIGIKQDLESISGTVHLKNNKLFVYFNGEHSDLDRQIKEGITRLFLKKMQMGSGFQEVVQNTFSLNLPFWFTEGLVDYTSVGWTTELENNLKEGILSGRFNNLTKINTAEQELVGHSIFNYIELKYGKEAVGNLLYLSRVNRSVEDGFLFVTGKYMDVVLEDWFNFNLTKFKKDMNTFEGPEEENILDLKKKKAFSNYQAKLSPDGKFLAYASNFIGRWKVYVYDIEKKETECLMSGGFKTTTLETDLSAPILAWEPKAKKLSVIYEKRDLFYIVHYTSEEFKREAKPEVLNKFQKVYDFSYAEDSRNIVMSALQKGQIDIFKYYLPTNKVSNITNDFYDDLQPSFYRQDGKSGFLFISNRPNDQLISGRLDTLLPNASFDVFFYDENNSIQQLAQLTNTPYANETHPQIFSDSTYTFLSDYTGISSQYIGQLQSAKISDRFKYIYSINEIDGRIDSVEIDQNIPLDSAMAYGQTVKEVLSKSLVPVFKVVGSNELYKKYYEGINEVSIAPDITKQSEVLKHNNKTIFLLSKLEDQALVADDTSAFMKNIVEEGILLERALVKKNELIQLAKDTDILEKKKEIVYQSKFDGWETLSEQHKQALQNSEQNEEGEDNSSAFRFSRTRQYFLKFMTEDLSVSLDNSLLVNNYQAFNPGSPVFNQPRLNGMLRFGITDLFEDHKIHGGIRVPFNFKGAEIYVTYENFKKRWDKSLTYYRKSATNEVGLLYQGVPNPINGTLNTRTNLIETQLKYPFNQLNSMRLKLGFRNDRNIIKSTELITLLTPNSSQNWTYARTEFVHDHTLPIAKNIKNGLRTNLYFEFQKEFPTKESEVFNQKVQLPIFNNSYLMLWGLDARYYQKVYKTIIWANRVAYSSSVGTKKMIYYLGGIDGMLSPEFNQTTIVNPNNTYAYQSLALNMRGFSQNIRNGNSYFVWNSELRVPIFSAFARRQIKSSLLENIQLVGFVDVGTAWEGFSPFSNGNIAQEIRTNAVSTARIDIYKQPIVIGFGSGLRTEIMGYFIRADLGWGYDTGKVNSPRLQVAIGYDF